METAVLHHKSHAVIPAPEIGSPLDPHPLLNRRLSSCRDPRPAATSLGQRHVATVLRHSSDAGATSPEVYEGPGLMAIWSRRPPLPSLSARTLGSLLLGRAARHGSS